MPFHRVLVGVKYDKKIDVDISLTGDGELAGIGAAGTGARKEPKYVALQVAIDKMNDLVRCRLVHRVPDPGVRAGPRAAAARRPGPGLADPGELEEAVHGVAGLPVRLNQAIIDNQEAHNTIADYFFTDGPAIPGGIVALADAFYEAAIDKGE